MNFKIFLICLLTFFWAKNFAQTDTEAKSLLADAEAKLKLENYEDALEDFLQLISIDPKNETYNYNTAVCYLNTNINKAKAVPYLENVVRNAKHNPNANYLLGRAYQFANRFDDAIVSFEKFKKNGAGNETNLNEVDQQIQHCLNAKELIKFPIDVIFQNLGKNINSSFPDYYPFVNENEAYIVYNSKRPMEKGMSKSPNGTFPNSIYISKVINGSFTSADIIGKPICTGNSGEEVIGMNAKGNMLLINKPNLRGESKLYLSTLLSGGLFSKLEELPPTINGSGDVIAATIDNDGNLIYFASNRKGGYGGTDIYSCAKLPNGKWSEAKNLGPKINTALNEDFPNLSPDGTTLYFSSKGHSSMGGYDIFKTSLNETGEGFSEVKNIGYPVNTSYDDFNFRISKNGRFGYVSSVRGGGLGDYDIYRVSFNDVEMDYTVLIGELSTKDSLSKIEYRDTFISVSNAITNEIVGNYLPNPSTGRFIIILPPGNYSVLVESPGFKETKYPIEIFDKVSYQSEKNLIITLTK
ncbi:MAG: hypothetical protein Q8T03_05405 [Bacteroidota bacterium]|nr:hypothetical protein [Bacteroidota bacterium]